MHDNLNSRLCFVLFGLMLTGGSPVLAVTGHHHSPYQDQHFNLNSTRRSSYDSHSSSYSSTRADNVSHAGGCATCMNGTSGGRGHVCPPVQNAILKVWVPDGMRVDVNGQTTKPQTLGGVHKNSRILSLEGLHTDRASLCTIVVFACDEFGCTSVYQRDLTVQAGGHYEVRIPHDVQPMHATEAPAFDAQIMEGYPMMESEFHGQLPINTGELMQVD